jgi:acetyl-CoA carboxylase carboxyltransferase component
MPVLNSKIDPKSEKFKANKAWMDGKLAELVKLEEKSKWQGEEKHVERAKSDGKMLARERIDALLDKGSPYLDLLPFAGFGRESFAIGGTMSAGIGLVSGNLCMVIANIATIKGGAIDKVTLEKAIRLNEISLENRLPAIYLVESAGANLEEQQNIFNLGGTNFREITRRSKKGIPTISVVFGNSTAGGAYIPGMSDYVVMIKNQSKVFLAGPPLVKMATGEDSTDEELGGAEMHSRISGVSDFLAKDETEAIGIARDLISMVNKDKTTAEFPPEAKAPKYDSSENMGIVTVDHKRPFDMREIIARTVDGSDFLEFKPDYGPTLVTGYAHIHGYRVGILANNGVLVSESANKGAHFIQLCNRSDTPLIFFQNISGFMVGKKYEQEGIIKDGAKMINAVSNSTVPALTVMIGNSYGAGNYAMCGRAFQPRFLFSWPNSKIAVMGAEALAGVMQMIQVKSGKLTIEEAQAGAQQLAKQVDDQSGAFYASGQLWDDGVIDPAKTREYLGMGLTVIHNTKVKGTRNFGVFRM